MQQKGERGKWKMLLQERNGEKICAFEKATEKGKVKEYFCGVRVFVAVVVMVVRKRISELVERRWGVRVAPSNLGGMCRGNDNI